LNDVVSVTHRETRRNGGVVGVAEKPVEVNERGFMKDLSQWTPGAAEYLATQQGGPRGLDRLTPDHWRVIDYMRSYFYRAGKIPSDAQVCKDLGLRRSELSQLFPGSMVTARRIAGLPGPRRSANGRKLSASQQVLARDWWARFTE
jgi:tRNA 2-thiouridine synthesizing protein E